jgi:LPS sulfotransferase NodH
VDLDFRKAETGSAAFTIQGFLSNPARTREGYLKFIVLTSSRTGSTWLVDMLNRVPGLQAHGELFLNRPRLTAAIAGRADYPRFLERHPAQGLRRIGLVFSYLDELYGRADAVGFKLMYSQFRQYPELFAYVGIRRLRVVHLTRLNQIDVLVSEERARETGVSHIRAGSSSGPVSVHLDAATLIERLHRLNKKPGQMRALLKIAYCPTLEITYESLLEGRGEFLRVLEFLGVAGQHPGSASSLEKRGVRTHREEISNYEEVRRVLASTPYRDMLRE